jgi:hypothetical protein
MATRKGKSGPLFFSFVHFLPFLPSGTISSRITTAQRYRASQIKISCSRHPFTLQREKGGKERRKKERTRLSFSPYSSLGHDSPENFVLLFEDISRKIFRTSTTALSLAK